MFPAMKPSYERTGETTYGSDGKPIHWYAVRWIEQGRVSTLSEAIAKYGRNIVLGARI